MVSIYHAPSYGEMEQIDMEILNKHPFLPAWE